MPIHDILSLEEISESLKDKRLYVISKEINVSYPILKNLRDCEERNYTTRVLVNISDYLRKNNT